MIEEAGLRGLDMALIKAYTREILTFLKHMELKEAVHAAIRPVSEHGVQCVFGEESCCTSQGSCVRPVCLFGRRQGHSKTGEDDPV